MAFICENLTDEDKRFIEGFQFHMPIGDVKSLVRMPEKWVSDREKGYFLICLAGRGYVFDQEYPPYYYRLIVDRQVIEIVARYQSEGDYDSGIKMTWRLESIFVPHSLNYIKEDLVLDIVKSAIAAYGNVHKNGHVISTNFVKD